MYTYYGILLRSQKVIKVIDCSLQSDAETSNEPPGQRNNVAPVANHIGILTNPKEYGCWGRYFRGCFVVACQLVWKHLVFVSQQVRQSSQ